MMGEPGSMMTAGEAVAGDKAPKGAWPEVLMVFLRLGLTSFGGPVAHLGYLPEADPASPPPAMAMSVCRIRRSCQRSSSVTKALN